jgi:NitT/TauT family transport system permease protein
MIFGFGYRMEVFVVAYATFWPFLILTYSAIRQVEPRLIEVSRAIGFGPLQSATKIILPSAAPRLITALRLTAGIALVVAVTCEIASNPQGLGHALMIAQETLRPADMWAYLFWIGCIGFAVNRLLLALERKLFAHRSDYDTTVSA